MTSVDSTAAATLTTLTSNLGGGAGAASTITTPAEQPPVLLTTTTAAAAAAASIMNSYRHSTNSFYGTMNPHINIPISSSTTVPTSACHFQKPPSPLRHNTTASMLMELDHDTHMDDDDDDDEELISADKVSASSQQMPNTLKFSQSILPPPTDSNSNSNNNNSNSDVVETNAGSNSSSPSSSSLSLSSFNEAIMSSAVATPNSSSAGGSFNNGLAPNSSTSPGLNPLLKLTGCLPDATNTLLNNAANNSPFSHSSSAAFTINTSTSTSTSPTNTSSMPSPTTTTTTPTPMPSTSFPSMLFDEDRERMRFEFESIKKPESHSRKSHKHHQRHYSHNDLDNRKHDEEKFFSSLQPNNYSKNRYHDVLPNESTRVRLTPLESGDGDYINANYINGEVPNSYRYYIACQAPLPSTIKDFWRMVWEEKSAVIVCLTRLEEDGKKKADIYWPESSSEPRNCGPFWIHLYKKVIFKEIAVSSLHLYRKGEESPREVVLLHYTQWPDSGAPAMTTHIRTMSVLVNTFKQRGNLKNSNGPVIVHCSAGIGRSGTFIAININMAKIERSANNEPHCNVSIKDTVMELRRQRRGMVQTFEQYCFIYRVINDVLNDMGRSLASPTKRRSCEMVRQPHCAMPRLDINNSSGAVGPSATFNPAETAASLSIITQMTQTLKFPQSSQFDNPFSNSKIRIPSTLNVSSSNILTIPPSSASSMTSALSSLQQLLNDSLNCSTPTAVPTSEFFQPHHQRAGSATIPGSFGSAFTMVPSLVSNSAFFQQHQQQQQQPSQHKPGNQSFLLYKSVTPGGAAANTCNTSGNKIQFNFSNTNEGGDGGNNSNGNGNDNSNNGNSISINSSNGGSNEHGAGKSGSDSKDNNGDDDGNQSDSPRKASSIKCF